MKKMSCYIDKAQAFSFLDLTQFSTERRRGCYAIWSLPNPKAGLFFNVGTGAFSRNTAADRCVFSSRHPPVVFLVIIISSSLFLWLNKSTQLLFLLFSFFSPGLVVGFSCSSAPKSHRSGPGGVMRSTPGCVVYF